MITKETIQSVKWIPHPGQTFGLSVCSWHKTVGPYQLTLYFSSACNEITVRYGEFLYRGPGGSGYHTPHDKVLSNGDEAVADFLKRHERSIQNSYKAMNSQKVK